MLKLKNFENNYNCINYTNQKKMSAYENLPNELQFLINDFINGTPKNNYNKVLSNVINNDYSKRNIIVIKNNYGCTTHLHFHKSYLNDFYRNDTNWNIIAISKKFLERRPVDELKRFAKSLGCKNYSKCKKMEVIELILTNTYPNSKQNSEQARFNKAEREQEKYYNSF